MLSAKSMEYLRSDTKPTQEKIKTFSDRHFLMERLLFTWRASRANVTIWWTTEREEFHFICYLPIFDVRYLKKIIIVKVIIIHYNNKLLYLTLLARNKRDIYSNDKNVFHHDVRTLLNFRQM